MTITKSYRLDEKIVKDFEELCKEKGFARGKRVSILLERDVQEDGTYFRGKVK